MTDATWTKGKKTIKGQYSYNYAANSFTVELEVKDILTGNNYRTLVVYDDTPEWNGWKLQSSGSSAG